MPVSSISVKLYSQAEGLEFLDPIFANLFFHACGKVIHCLLGCLGKGNDIFGRDGDAVRGIVHVRDTLDSADSTAFAAPLARPVLELDRAVPVYEAFARMRKSSTQVVVVRGGGHILGVVTLGDILPNLLPAVS